MSGTALRPPREPFGFFSSRRPRRGHGLGLAPGRKSRQSAATPLVAGAVTAVTYVLAAAIILFATGGGSLGSGDWQSAFWAAGLIGAVSTVLLVRASRDPDAGAADAFGPGYAPARPAASESDSFPQEISAEREEDRIGHAPTSNGGEGIKPPSYKAVERLINRR